MPIRDLIDRDYFSVSILEDMQQVAEWLREHAYYAVIDEEAKAVGIVTAQDFVHYPKQQVIDADISKPAIRPNMSLAEVFKLMNEKRYAYLPVFDGLTFMGVISIWAVTQRLLQNISALEQHL